MENNTIMVIMFPCNNEKAAQKMQAIMRLISKDELSSVEPGMSYSDTIDIHVDCDLYDEDSIPF